MLNNETNDPYIQNDNNNNKMSKSYHPTSSGKLNLPDKKGFMSLPTPPPPIPHIITSPLSSPTSSTSSFIRSPSKLYIRRRPTETESAKKLLPLECYAVCPTFTNTPMMRNNTGEALIEQSKQHGIIAPSTAISDGMLYLIDNESKNGSVMRFDTENNETIASIVQFRRSPPLPAFSSKM